MVEAGLGQRIQQRRHKYTYDDTRCLFSPSFLWKEVPRRGGGWPHETVLPYSGKPTPPRFARLPLPEEGARMIFKETRIQSLSFPVRVSRFPHICRAVPLSSSVFHAACALSAPSGHLPLEGKAAIREYHPLKKVAHHPCEPIRSPSTVIPSAAEGSLLHCRHMHTCALTQTTPWCFLFRLSLAHDLPLCKKDPSTSVGMTFKKDG